MLRTGCHKSPNQYGDHDHRCDVCDRNVQPYGLTAEEADAEKGENYLLEVDNPLVVPKGAKVRLLITSNDVLHAWWVPDLAIKKDAIPGVINEVWFRAEQTGTLRGQCAELCGKDHGYMPVVVEVVEPDAYLAWAETQRASSTRVATNQ